MDSMQTKGHIISLDNKETFERVFDKYASALAFFATRLLGNRQDAEDIVSETFIKLWEKREGFRVETQVKAFLYITARNACFNSLKRGRNAIQRRNEYCNLLDTTDDHALNQITRSEVLREIHQLIEGLPRECQKVMKLRLIGKEREEIASELGISIHTVKNQIARGTYLIRKKYFNNHSLAIAWLAIKCFMPS